LVEVVSKVLEAKRDLDDVVARIGRGMGFLTEYEEARERFVKAIEENLAPQLELKAEKPRGRVVVLVNGYRAGEAEFMLDPWDLSQIEGTDDQKLALSQEVDLKMRFMLQFADGAPAAVVAGVPKEFGFSHLRAMIAALPTCVICERVATFRSGADRSVPNDLPVCDDHARMTGIAGELPYADAVRSIDKRVRAFYASTER
jgi:hypothetical protein